MRRKVLVANWKMNKTAGEAQVLMSQLLENADALPAGLEVILACPYIYLREFVRKTDQLERMSLAAQNCHYEQKGAFTGEISPSMLKSIGITICIVGHSERRVLFGESDDVVKRKISACVHVGVTPILCVGEHLEDREAGKEFLTVQHQVHTALSALEQQQQFMVAYEPVWAIGTGRVASPEQAQEMHAFIRQELSKIHTNWIDRAILYGGSCNDSNAYPLFSCKDVDGGLVGTASLSANSFIRIAQSFS